MTTIVYAGGVLAADRRVTLGDTIVGDTYRKVFVTPDGFLGAWAGSVASGHAFAEWASGSRDTEPPRGQYSGILIGPKGKVYEFEEGRPMPNPRRAKFYTWGSGSPAALGALHAGADARKAVLIAQKIDSASGGGVDVVKLPKE